MLERAKHPPTQLREETMHVLEMLGRARRKKCKEGAQGARGAPRGTGKTPNMCSFGFCPLLYACNVIFSSCLLIAVVRA